MITDFLVWVDADRVRMGVDGISAGYLLRHCHECYYSETGSQYWARGAKDPA